jgi:hypothetical protein
MAAKRAPRGDIYQIKVTLKGSKPPIWRRIQVPGDIRLDKLHRVLQVVMGWDDYHLHQFIVGGEYYGEPHPDYEMWGPEMRDETRVSLRQIAPQEKSRFVYEYDFGDGWEHVLLVEKILPPEPGVDYPRCIKGKGACPPEDVGGIWGYYDFLETIANPDDPEHDDLLDWIGGEFDPEHFDLDEVNAGLKSEG